MSPSRLLAGLLLLAALESATAAGFATRELNPMLQPVFLPSLIQAPAADGWRIDHSLLITNTLQSKTRGDERLTIDLENYRYEFELSRRRGHWLSYFKVPLIATRGGELDNLIEDWHDFFGFPNGERGNFPQDQVNIEWRRDGELEYSQTDSSEGIGDITLAIGYQRPGAAAWYAGIDLPTGSADDYTGNEAPDLALWVTREIDISDKSSVFGMFGISFPGDDGRLEGLLVDEIWVAQVGIDYRFWNDYVATAQLDMHSRSIEDSEFRAFTESYQLVLGLGFLRLLDSHRLDLFFTEDILVRSAPDITFGLRLAREF